MSEVLVDVTKCIGCRYGVPSFVKEDDGFHHLDIFATQSYGIQRICHNSDVIKDMLIDLDNGIFNANELLKTFYFNQSFWFEDILGVLSKIFTEEQVNVFITEKVDGVRRIDLHNELLEQEVIKQAELCNFIIDKENYPDLFIFNKE